MNEEEVRLEVLNETLADGYIDILLKKKKWTELAETLFAKVYSSTKTVLERYPDICETIRGNRNKSDVASGVVDLIVLAISSHCLTELIRVKVESIVNKG